MCSIITVNLYVHVIVSHHVIHVHYDSTCIHVHVSMSISIDTAPPPPPPSLVPTSRLVASTNTNTDSPFSVSMLDCTLKTINSLEHLYTVATTIMYKSVKPWKYLWNFEVGHL